MQISPREPLLTISAMQGPSSRGDCADMVLHGQLWQRSNARKDFLWSQGSVTIFGFAQIDTAITVKTHVDPPGGFSLVRATAPGSQAFIGSLHSELKPDISCLGTGRTSTALPLLRVKSCCAFVAVGNWGAPSP